MYKLWNCLTLFVCIYLQSTYMHKQTEKELLNLKLHVRTNFVSWHKASELVDCCKKMATQMRDAGRIVRR